MKIENCAQDQRINNLVKKYNILLFYKKLVEELNIAYPETDFSGFSKPELHKLINEIIIENFKGEQIYKYSLFKYFSQKPDVIGAFEMNVNSSRVDFIAINGVSSSFEIKSSLDNLNKLNKQTEDYLKIFEYNYLFIDNQHLEKALTLLPESFGIWLFKNGEFFEYKVAKYNKRISSKFQLDNLTKRELNHFFNQNDGDKEKILAKFKKDEINERFKKAIKTRYLRRWEFIQNNKEQILPIDIQFFFQTPINPKTIYSY
jgi:hypothetical protein